MSAGSPPVGDRLQLSDAGRGVESVALASDRVGVRLVEGSGRLGFGSGLDFDFLAFRVSQLWIGFIQLA